MSGFFTLGSGTGTGTRSGTNSLFLFKNEEIYNKGFELWQQYYQQQERLHNQDADPETTQPGPGPGPGGSAAITERGTPVVIGSGSGSGSAAITERSRPGVSSYNYNCDEFGNYRLGVGVMRSSSGGGGINCQDCGNQAKKDCVHFRCRTCCKSRGFHCQTHVKSTWVPAAKRRERQQQLASIHQQQQQNTDQQLSLMRGENPKRHRDQIPGAHSLPCTRLPSGLEVGQLPSELTSPAIFRCVRVSAMDDADEQFAYQTAVNIGGHVFKGILYDQGPESRYTGGESSSGGAGTQLPPHNRIAPAVTTTATTNAPVTLFDPSLYPAPLNAFMAGTQFFPPPRP